jgi:FAD-linked sulfhydryl oxidase
MIAKATSLAALISCAFTLLYTQKKSIVYLSSSKNCKDPACQDKVDLLQQSFKSNTSKKKLTPIPPTKEELGQSGWKVLHSFAAYYPEHPTKEDEKVMITFLNSFAHLYPCKECGSGFALYLKKFPPHVDERSSLCVYLCEAHNKVNEELGKPLVKCSISVLDEMWKLKGSEDEVE